MTMTMTETAEAVAERLGNLAKHVSISEYDGLAGAMAIIVTFSDDQTMRLVAHSVDGTFDDKAVEKIVGFFRRHLTTFYDPEAL